MQHPPEVMLALRSFRQIYAAVRLNYKAVDPETGIGTAQLWALGVIRAHAGIGINALAKTMDLSQPSTSNLAKALQDKGLVRAERSDADKRNVELYCTEQGLDVLTQVPEVFSGGLPMALGKLPPQTLARLHEDLQQLIGLLQVEELETAQTPAEE
ncbi:MAG: MarR family winged helix-turn-helix transcriptional regulator [Brachymonas sp.]|nr:MarR family winged helix-turn-helix transcriptional regulator [Brachymonas sp.]